MQKQEKVRSNFLFLLVSVVFIISFGFFLGFFASWYSKKPDNTPFIVFGLSQPVNYNTNGARPVFCEKMVVYGEIPSNKDSCVCETESSNISIEDLVHRHEQIKKKLDI